MIDISETAMPSATRAAMIESCKYQPYRFPGGIWTGAGLSFIKGTPLRYVAETDEHPDKDAFIREAAHQAKMYETFIEFANKHVGVKGRSFLDVACNSGYFCYRMSQLGASTSVGFDVGDFDGTFQTMNGAIGSDARYIRGHYDMKSHQLIGLGDDKFDIVFNTAFMCHSSDPTFLLEALGNRAKKAILIFSKFFESDDYLVKYATTTSRYFGGKFPTCFDATTEMSDSLLKFGLKELGFSTVLEVPRDPSWLPRSPAWRAFLGVR